MRTALQVGIAFAGIFVLLSIWSAWGGASPQPLALLAAAAGYTLLVAAVVLLAVPPLRPWASATFVAAFGALAAQFLVDLGRNEDHVAYAQSMVFMLGALLLAAALTATGPTGRLGMDAASTEVAAA